MVKRETTLDILRDDAIRRPLRMSGSLNLLLLLGVVFAVALLDPSKPIPGTDIHAFPFCRELVMLGLAGASLALTPKGIRESNRFNYHAIIEVAALFIGIFLSMQVPLAVLKANGADLGLESPTHFFWLTGILSSFLDNAPTYLVFFQTAEAMSPAGRRGHPRPAERRPHPRGPADRDQPWRRLHGRQHLHRQRPELHGQVDRRAIRGSNAQFLRLHGLQRAGVDSSDDSRELALPLNSTGAIPDPPGPWRRRWH